MKKVSGDKIVETNLGGARDIEELLENDLFKLFWEKISSYPEDKRKTLREIAIKAMIQSGGR